MAKLLPRLQLIFAVLFGAVSLFGPMLVAQGSLVILTAALAGVLLGGITFLIGWRLQFARMPVVYPFASWSVGILALFLNPTQARSLKQANQEYSPQAGGALGIFSLAVGTLLVVSTLIVMLLVLSS